jgi:hypothetical protein
MYRTLSATHVTETARRLAARVAGRFPDSGLSKVSRELADIAGETDGRVQRLRRPAWLLRGAIVLAVVLAAVAAVLAPAYVEVPAGSGGLSELMQGVEAAINNVIFIAVALYFMVTLEMRPKRRAALAALHELRSMAHVVDMHQLTKDPDALLTHAPPIASSPERPLTQAELGRYLDYCSEMLSIISKLAALYLQHLNDAVVLGAVDEVQQLTDGLSAKIWQKIMILDRDRAPA